MNLLVGTERNGTNGRYSMYRIVTKEQEQKKEPTKELNEETQQNGMKRNATIDPYCIKYEYVPCIMELK